MNSLFLCSQLCPPFYFMTTKAKRHAHVLYIFCFIIYSFFFVSFFLSASFFVSFYHSSFAYLFYSSFSSFFLVFFPPSLLYFILTNFLPFIMFLFPLFISHNAKQRIASGTINGTDCDVTFLMSRCKISDNAYEHPVRVQSRNETNEMPVLNE